jgi:hypothetical protein
MLRIWRRPRDVPGASVTEVAETMAAPTGFLVVLDRDDGRSGC